MNFIKKKIRRAKKILSPKRWLKIYQLYVLGRISYRMTKPNGDYTCGVYAINTIYRGKSPGGIVPKFKGGTWNKHPPPPREIYFPWVNRPKYQYINKWFLRPLAAVGLLTPWLSLKRGVKGIWDKNTPDGKSNVIMLALILLATIAMWIF